VALVRDRIRSAAPPVRGIPWAKTAWSKSGSVPRETASRGRSRQYFSGRISKPRPGRWTTASPKTIREREGQWNAVSPSAPPGRGIGCHSDPTLWPPPHRKWMGRENSIPGGPQISASHSREHSSMSRSWLALVITMTRRRDAGSRRDAGARIGSKIRVRSDVTTACEVNSTLWAGEYADQWRTPGRISIGFMNWTLVGCRRGFGGLPRGRG
jgi:hypothetical protein